MSMRSLKLLVGVSLLALSSTRFRMVGRPETLPNPDGHGSPVDFRSATR